LIGINKEKISDEKILEIDKKLIEVAKKFRKNGKNVYFLLDNPFGEEIDPHSMLVRNWGGISYKSQPPLFRDLMEERLQPIKSNVVNIAAISGSNIIDPLDYLCIKSKCSAFYENGELIYKDYDHLSLYSSNSRIRYLDFIYK
jgi:hypothetical protein